MNRLHETGVAVVLGAGMFALSRIAVDALVYSPEEINTRVEACAEELGQNAVETEILPPGCQDYAEVSGGATEVFDYSIMRVGNAEGDTVRETVTYVLPSSDDFLAESYKTPNQIAEVHADNTKMEVIFSVATASIVFCFMEAGGLATRQRKTRDSETLQRYKERKIVQ